MKKNVILASVLLVGLLTIASCTQDDSVSNEKLQQKDGSSVSFTSPTARFVAVNGTYTAIPSKDYEFTSILLSGNNVVNITISNSGSVAANMEVLGNNGYYLIGSKQIPTGGGYYTYSFPISSLSGYLTLRIGSTTSNRVMGNLQISSY